MIYKIILYKVVQTKLSVLMLWQKRRRARDIFLSNARRSLLLHKSKSTQRPALCWENAAGCLLRHLYEAEAVEMEEVRAVQEATSCK